MKKMLTLAFALVAACCMSVASYADNPEISYYEDGSVANWVYWDANGDYVETSWNDDESHVVTTYGNDYETFVEVEGLYPIRHCSERTFSLGDNNLAIFKKGHMFVIWTAEQLCEEDQETLAYAILNSGIGDLSNMPNLAFDYGFDANFYLQLDKDSVSISETAISFPKTNVWSWFYLGKYVFPEPDPIQYVWVATGEGDSATGYDPNGQIASKGNWFMYNTLNVKAMSVGDTATFDIQAGQWKNGTNFVGTYTVTKVAANQYSIDFDCFNLITDNYAAQFDGYHLWFNGTGKFEKSPGNQKGKATKAEKGTSFTFTGSKLYIFAHFDVSYWALVPVVPEAYEEVVEEIYYK